MVAKPVKVKKPKLTKVLLKKLNSIELRLIAVSGMKLSLEKAFGMKEEDLIDFIYTDQEAFIKIDIDALEKSKKFRPGISAYLKKLVNYLTGSGEIPDIINEPIEEELEESKSLNETEEEKELEEKQEVIEEAENEVTTPDSVLEILGKDPVALEKTVVETPGTIEIDFTSEFKAFDTRLKTLENGILYLINILVQSENDVPPFKELKDVPDVETYYQPEPA